MHIPCARGDAQLGRDALDHAVRVRVALLAPCSKRSEHGVVILPLLLGLGPLDSREQITRTSHRIDARLGLSSLCQGGQAGEGSTGGGEVGGWGKGKGGDGKDACSFGRKPSASPISLTTSKWRAHAASMKMTVPTEPPAQPRSAPEMPRRQCWPQRSSEGGLRVWRTLA